MANIRIEGVSKHFGGLAALQEVSLEVRDGEFVALLGPSGCGKTTLLRIVAGLEKQSGGRVLIGGREVSNLPPRSRGLAMVFQNYAVFPHLRVRDNIAFGLVMTGSAQDRVTRQVERAAALMHIEHLLDRYPAQLSGGQRQRVAVARALAVEPAVLLMDEPLSNLDALLRLEMRAELKAILTAARTTTLYVTHDQREAMGLADRIAIMQEGHIVQMAPPLEIYRHPSSVFVGGFVGDPPMNFLRVQVEGGLVRLGTLTLKPPADATEAVTLGIRPEDLEVSRDGNGFAFRVQVPEPLGPQVLLTGDADGQSLRVAMPPDRVVHAGETVTLRPNPERIAWMDPKTGLALEQRSAADELIDPAREILRRNDRGGYTVPTDRLYPFQWNWDSGFVAMGWMTFDEDRGFTEVERLLEGQWDDGLVPQIVFHAPSDDYFPGPTVWGVRHVPPTSGITQPPILASAVRRMLDAARDRSAAEARVAAIFPRLLASHRWWRTARDPTGSGLVSVLHPWETGMDNSPAWDTALARVPTETSTPVQRRDTTHVDASMRPRAEEYQRFIHLVDLYRDSGWQPERMLAETPFRIADIATNSILLRAERDLLALASRFGGPGDAAEIASRADNMKTAIGGLWSARHGLFVSLDQITGAPIEVATSAGLLPLYAGAADAERTQAMLATLRRWADYVRFLVPSTAPDDTRFDPLRYWRGPIWAVVNWMIAVGLADTGETATATELRRATRNLIAHGGFSEYFDPRDGRGIGGANFSWTAAIYLLLT
jgi:ABC-type sugar transport system ATPase subunit